MYFSKWRSPSLSRDRRWEKGCIERFKLLSGFKLVLRALRWTEIDKSKVFGEAVSLH